MAIYNCSIPVISAVGHEIDFTISDFVADLRAPTPSAAAELCAPDIAQISRSIEAMSATIERYATSNIKAKYDELKSTYQRLVTLSPTNKIKQSEQELIVKSQRLNLACQNIINRNDERYKKSVSMLEALSPLKVITRGYSITYKDKQILTSIDNVIEDDELITKLKDGKFISKVIEVTKS